VKKDKKGSKRGETGFARWVVVAIPTVVGLLQEQQPTQRLATASHLVGDSLLEVTMAGCRHPDNGRLVSVSRLRLVFLFRASFGIFMRTKDDK